MSLATFEMSMEDVRQAEPSSHAGPSTPPPASRPSPGASRPPLRILIVEDDQFTRQALEGMLNSMAQSPLLYGLPAMRLEIHAASSGETGWQTLTGMPIDIAFIDLGLPGITGFDLSWFYLSKDAAPGASRPHDTAMIACSSADVTPEKLHEAGMHDFLKKPVTMPALRHIIHKWLPTPSDLPQVQLPPSPSRTNRGAFAARVLHVEDCEITKTATCGMLEQMGLWVDTASSGEEAIKLLSSSRLYHLVLIDVNLQGGMSGCANPRHAEFCAQNATQICAILTPRAPAAAAGTRSRVGTATFARSRGGAPPSWWRSPRSPTAKRAASLGSRTASRSRSPPSSARRSCRPSCLESTTRRTTRRPTTSRWRWPTNDAVAPSYHTS